MSVTICQPRIMLPCASFFLSLHCVVAQAAPWQLEAGAGLIGQQQIWKKMPAVNNTVPYFTASHGRWRLGIGQGDLVSYSFYQHNDVRIQSGIGIRDNGYDAKTSLNSKWSDDSVFRGYQRPEPEVTGSVGVRWTFLSLQLTQQLHKEQSSQVIDLEVEIPLFQQNSGLHLQALIGASWMNDDYSRRIYGVAPGNQNLSVGRPVFQPGAAVNYRLELQMQYPLGPHTMLLANTGATRLADDLQRSPLVGKAHNVEAMLLLVYRF